MGRMHSGGKGISKSALPYRRSVPSVSLIINCSYQPTCILMSSNSGWNCHLKKSRNTSSSFPARVWPLPKSVSSSVIHMVLPKSVSSPETKSFASSAPRVLPQIFQKICTTWSRRLSLSTSILNAIARIVMPSSGSFWSKAVSTVWPVTTRPRWSSPQPGNILPRPPLLLSLKKVP